MEALSTTVWRDVAAWLEGSDTAKSRAEIREYIRAKWSGEIEALQDARTDAWINGVMQRLRDASGEKIDKGARTAQSPLPGFDLRAFYSVPDGESGDVKYVPYHAMTGADWAAHRALLVTNIANANERLRDHDEKLDVLRPYFTRDLTLGEALDELRGAHS